MPLLSLFAAPATLSLRALPRARVRGRDASAVVARPPAIVCAPSCSFSLVPLPACTHCKLTELCTHACAGWQGVRG